MGLTLPHVTQSTPQIIIGESKAKFMLMIIFFNIALKIIGKKTIS